MVESRVGLGGAFTSINPPEPERTLERVAWVILRDIFGPFLEHGPGQIQAYRQCQMRNLFGWRIGEEVIRLTDEQLGAAYRIALYLLP